MSDEHYELDRQMVAFLNRRLMALAQLLIDKGIMTLEEFDRYYRLVIEADENLATEEARDRIWDEALKNRKKQ